jgi:hypothetical protein
LQGLQEIWDLNRKDYSWATAGYLGAIESGQTICGLLIGSSIAIGLRSGQKKNCLPLEDKKGRAGAVKAVKKLYEDFIEKFHSTECRKLTGCDFSNADDSIRYIEEEVYKNKCFVFFNFVMNRFIEMEKDQDRGDPD